MTHPDAVKEMGQKIAAEIEAWRVRQGRSEAPASLGQGRYSFAHVFAALSERDARRLHGVTGAEPLSYSLGELVAAGVSDEGIGLVVRNREVDGAPAGEEKPRVVTLVALEDTPHLSEVMAGLVDLKNAAVVVKLEHSAGLSVDCGCGDRHCGGSVPRAVPTPRDLFGGERA
nr:hypothetical protein [Actinomyces sp.]